MSPRIDEGREWVPDVIERRGRGGRKLPGPLPCCRLSRLEVAVAVWLGARVVFLLWVLS